MSERRWNPDVDLSPSRVKRYTTCPLSYRFRYVDKVPDPPEGAGRVGLLVHGALELVARERIGVVAPCAATAAELLEALGASVPGVAGVTPDEIQQARDLLELLSPFDPSAGGEILGAEGEWVVDVGEGVLCGLYFDLVRRTDRGVIEVVDWKTGQRQAREDLEVDPQLGLNLAAVAQEYPGEEVAVTFAYLDEGGVWNQTIELRDGTEWIPGFAKGEALAAYQDWTRGAFRARVGDGCRTCFARDRCGPFREHLERLEVPTDPPSPKDLPMAELLEQRTRFKEAAGAFDQLRKDLDKEIKFRLEDQGEKKLEVEGFRALLKERKTGKYDVSVLPELAATLGQDPYDVIREAGSVSAKGINKLVKNNEDARRLVAKYRGPGKSRHVEVKRLKGAV